MGFEKLGSQRNNAPIAHTAAHLKGRRLRMARALTGFSRQELYEKIGIATSTIDTWESGRVELTERSAIRVCVSLKQVGIYCSSEWLLTGEGTPPRIMDELEKSMLSTARAQVTYQLEASSGVKNKKIPSFVNEDIRRELSFFLNLHKDSIFHIVDRDFLNCRYKIGDCVAGIEDDLQKLTGKVIIGVLKSGETLLCKLVNYYNSDCTVFLGVEKSNEKEQIIRAAEVVWHRMLKRFN
jgi:transcriptional regulator with XRE-family HTH domain